VIGSAGEGVTRTRDGQRLGARLQRAQGERAQSLRRPPLKDPVGARH
jgi:hypothetical protein